MILEANSENPLLLRFVDFERVFQAPVKHEVEPNIGALILKTKIES